MVSRLLVVCLIAWTASVASVASQPASKSDSPPAPKLKSNEPAPAATQRAAGEQPSEPPSNDDELIKNLDLIQNLDLLDNVDVLGAVSAPGTPEEEF